MRIFTVDDSPWTGPWLYTGGGTEGAPDSPFQTRSSQASASQKSAQMSAQKQRISAIVGQAGKAGPWVNDKTLSCYFQFLAKNLQLPFSVWYPEPRRFENYAEYECSITELLDPKQVLGDPFDGIYCRSCKDGFEVNLPLVELTLPDDCVNLELLEDYRHWFWNWRAP